jgi:integrase
MAGKRRAMALGLRLKQPRRIIVPLSADQVATFWHSFHSFRDLALVGLMLLDGLRSCGVLSFQLEDLQLADAQMRVIGNSKGNLAAFRCELAKPFEHEARLRELLVKQTELNAALDLHKNDVQAAADRPEGQPAGDAA